MPSTIIDTRFYTALEAAQDLEMPIERVNQFYAAVVAAGKEPVAYYQGAAEPMLSGKVLRLLKGRAQQEQQQPKPTYKRTGRKK